MGKLARVGIAVGCVAVVALEGLAVAGWQGWLPKRSSARQAAAQASQQVVRQVLAVEAAVASIPARIGEKLAQTQAGPAPLLARPEDPYYAQLRRSIRWVPTRIGSAQLMTPDLHSRMLLAKSAADRARLHEVGLGFRDVYGIINAETSWVPRLGASKDGTPNLGIAQFEPATARALAVRNPNDPVESVHAAALHMKEAALWSQQRLAGLKLSDAERATKLREGVSIYYNLSSRGRSVWNGRNTRRLPRETQLHIHNARIGAEQAGFFETQLRTAHYTGPRDGAVITASSLRN